MKCPECDTKMQPYINQAQEKKNACPNCGRLEEAKMKCRHNWGPPVFPAIGHEFYTCKKCGNMKVVLHFMGRDVIKYYEGPPPIEKAPYRIIKKQTW